MNNNRQFWTVWLKIVALATILTIPTLLTNAYGSDDGNFKIKIISDDMVHACATIIEYKEKQCRNIDDYSTTFVFYNMPVGALIFAEITDSYGDNFCAIGENHKKHAPEILRPVTPCASGESNADMDNEQIQSSYIEIHGDNNKVRVDQRQQNIVDKIIEDINDILD
jgi:hypothetical protein